MRQVSPDPVGGPGDAGIRVNAVWPGATPPARTAFGRVGEPDDIGAMIATLGGDESRWITAQNIEESGGYRL
ncbi:hypothetical protein [Streptomyces sp. NPDC047718]|uniref:hypothetical protein n=1 Tax=Streptomyces sp. NPDC047718 TaxID=3155479 RepID=UPI0033F545F5